MAKPGEKTIQVNGKSFSEEEFAQLQALDNFLRGEEEAWSGELKTDRKKAEGKLKALGGTGLLESIGVGAMHGLTHGLSDDAERAGAGGKSKVEAAYERATGRKIAGTHIKSKASNPAAFVVSQAVGALGAGALLRVGVPRYARNAASRIRENARGAAGFVRPGAERAAQRIEANIANYGIKSPRARALALDASHGALFGYGGFDVSEDEPVASPERLARTGAGAALSALAAPLATSAGAAGTNASLLWGARRLGSKRMLEPPGVTRANPRGRPREAIDIARSRDESAARAAELQARELAIDRLGYVRYPLKGANDRDPVDRLRSPEVADSAEYARRGGVAKWQREYPRDLADPDNPTGVHTTGDHPRALNDEDPDIDAMGFGGARRRPGAKPTTFEANIARFVDLAEEAATAGAPLSKAELARAMGLSPDGLRGMLSAAASGARQVSPELRQRLQRLRPAETDLPQRRTNVPGEQGAPGPGTAGQHPEILPGIRRPRGFLSPRPDGVEPRDIVLGYNDKSKTRDLGIDLDVRSRTGEDSDVARHVAVLATDIRKTVDQAKQTGQMDDLAAAWNVTPDELQAFAANRSSGRPGPAEERLTAAVEIIESANRNLETLTLDEVARRLRAKGYRAKEGKSLASTFSQARRGRSDMKFSDELRERIARLRMAAPYTSRMGFDRGDLEALAVGSVGGSIANPDDPYAGAAAGSALAFGGRRALASLFMSGAFNRLGMGRGIVRRDRKPPLESEMPNTRDLADAALEPIAREKISGLETGRRGAAADAIEKAYPGPAGKQRPASVRERRFKGPDGRTYVVEFKDRADIGDTLVNFREDARGRFSFARTAAGLRSSGNPYEATGRNTGRGAREILRGVETAIRQDIREGGRNDYSFAGNSPKKRRIYDMIAKRLGAPEGYELTRSRSGQGNVYLGRKERHGPDPVGQFVDDMMEAFTRQDRPALESWASTIEAAARKDPSIMPRIQAAVARQLAINERFGATTRTGLPVNETPEMRDFLHAIGMSGNKARGTANVLEEARGAVRDRFDATRYQMALARREGKTSMRPRHAAAMREEMGRYEAPAYTGPAIAGRGPSLEARGDDKPYWLNPVDFYAGKKHVSDDAVQMAGLVSSPLAYLNERFVVGPQADAAFGEDDELPVIEGRAVERPRTPQLPGPQAGQSALAGNAPIDRQRPILKNADGSFSTERTITVERDGRWFNVPTIIDGERHDEREISQRFEDGEDLPTVGEFASLEEAEQAAQSRSQEIGGTRQADRGPRVPVLKPRIGARAAAQPAGSEGTSSRQAKEIQELLMSAGIDVGPKGADSVIGGRTKAAMEAFARITKMQGEISPGRVLARLKAYPLDRLAEELAAELEGVQ